MDGAAETKTRNASDKKVVLSLGKHTTRNRSLLSLKIDIFICIFDLSILMLPGILAYD
jgi:putative ribosome biogenesis GTPase RsgA